MWLLDLILLILLGVLGIASWLKGRQPKLGSQLGPLEGVAGWIGLAGLIWGIVLLLRWISALGIFGFAPVVLGAARCFSPPLQGEGWVGMVLLPPVSLSAIRIFSAVIPEQADSI